MASPSTSTGSRSNVVPGKLRVLLEMIKWEHTIFALPFAYAGMLAAPVPFSVWNLVWITVAMIGARTAGMSLNRIIDARIDVRNPRTADRAIPKGLVGLREAWLFTGVAVALLVLATFFSGPDHARSLAARGSGLRGLSVHQTLYLALPSSSRHRKWSRASGGVGCRYRRRFVDAGAHLGGGGVVGCGF